MGQSARRSPTYHEPHRAPARRLPLTATLAVVVAFGTVFSAPRHTTAEAPATPPFLEAWQRTDQPVAGGHAVRTWMWGPEAFTGALDESYAESPSGSRIVQYYDKSRMEITNPNGDPQSIWYVTNGLLVVELVSGQMQTGNSSFEARAPAEVNVAGDADDSSGPTYATIAAVRFEPASAAGAMLTGRIDRDGTVTNDAALASYGVTAAHHVSVPGIDHQIASPFWAFMNSSGTVFEDGAYVTASLFNDPFYATGYPIGEAYWAKVKVGGTAKDVLLQCFERRCLTYTPGNAPEWQVEAGNVGRHYHAWRYAQTNPGPSAEANALAQTLLNTTTDDARYAALLDVMAALNVGVYTADGQPLLEGAERAEGDFYLYDFELWMMAHSLGRRESWGLAEIAAPIAAILVPDGDPSIDAAVLGQALLGSVAEAAQTPNDHLSLTPLLLRQLGLQQAIPYDLFSSVPAGGLRVDALSAWLITADALLPIVEAAGPTEIDTTELVALSNGILSSAPLDSVSCRDITGKPGKKWRFGRTWSRLPTDMDTPDSNVQRTVVNTIHGSFLAYSISIEQLQGSGGTAHYGHHAPGVTLRFSVMVWMLDTLPANIARCGWMAGVQLPPEGPIAGATVLWNGWDDLFPHGAVWDCAGRASCNVTDADGIAWFSVQILQEVFPGLGVEETAQGVVSANVTYKPPTESGKPAPLFLNGLTVAPMPWTISYHVALFDLTMTLMYDLDVSITLAPGPGHTIHLGAAGTNTIVGTIAAPVEPYEEWGGARSLADSVYYYDGYFTNPACSGSWSSPISDVVVEIENVDPVSHVVGSRFAGTVPPEHRECIGAGVYTCAAQFGFEFSLSISTEQIVELPVDVIGEECYGADDTPVDVDGYATVTVLVEVLGAEESHPEARTDR